jgi:hypothetical protein
MKIATQMTSGWIFAVVVAGIGGFLGLGLGLVFYDDTYGTPISTMREVRRIAIIVTIGVAVGALIWILCYPPLCLLGGPVLPIEQFCGSKADSSPQPVRRSVRTLHTEPFRS